MTVQLHKPVTLHSAKSGRHAHKLGGRRCQSSWGRSEKERYLFPLTRNKPQFLAFSARSRVVIPTTLSWMYHSFDVDKKVFNLINRWKRGIFGGKNAKEVKLIVLNLFCLFNVNWFHLSNAILLISYRLHYRLWNKNNADWWNMCDSREFP
jgi:hypothetical protein